VHWKLSKKNEKELSRSEYDELVSISMVSISVDSPDFKSHELCPSSLARPSVFARLLYNAVCSIFNIHTRPAGFQADFRSWVWACLRRLLKNIPVSLICGMAYSSVLSYTNMCVR
jgi:hypothetical protein